MTAASNVITHDVFISYAEADRAWVDGFLLDALDEAGASVHSEDAFALGVPRLVEFERAIQQSRRTLLILSPAYLADTFGQFVDVLVNSYGMETATWPVIPLILQPVALPPRLSQLEHLDATTPEKQQAALVRLCAELKRPVPGPAPLPECPYPGMVPFDEADSARFFGREQEVQELVERLRLHPFLAVIGASGSGKSSLVRAGLLPALRKNRSFGAGGWLIRTLRPGETPLDTLAAALGATMPPPPVQPSAAPAADDLLSMLLIKADPHTPNSAEALATNGRSAATPGDNSGTLFDAPPAAAALLAATADAQRLLLVVDQFEETFTVARAQAALFQQALLALAAAPGCYVVLTVRADFYADLMASPLWEQIQAHRVEVAPLGEAGLRRAIVRPAEQAGVAVEAALVERLTADAAGEPGVLPLVQETLVLLWERLERRFLPMRAYEALVLSRSAYGGQDGHEPNGLQVAIARRADATLASLHAAQQPLARRIFLRLIQFGEGRADTRRQQPVTALRSAGDDLALFEATLQRLATSRLLTMSGTETTEHRPPTTDQRGNNPSSVVGRPSSVRVDIAHEALIRGWPALQGWLSERREGELTRRRLADKAAEWVRLGRANGGLLDEIELLEAERWLQSPDADEMGFDQSLPELAVWSRAAIEQAAQAQEDVRRRELEQAQALAEEQTRRAEEQAAAGKQLRQRAVFLGVALVAVAVVAVFAALKYRQADQGERQARAGELAAQSELSDSTIPQRGLLLAVEAISTTLRKDNALVGSTEQALRNALARTDWQLIDDQIMRYGEAASADGRFFAALRLDGTIAVRDLRAADPTSPTLLLRSPDDSLTHIGLSDNGELLAGIATTAVHVWRLTGPTSPTEPWLQLNRPSQQSLINILFSPHGRWLLISTNTSVFLWDLRAANPSSTIRKIDTWDSTQVEPSEPRNPLFSADESILALRGQDQGLDFYDLSAAGLGSAPFRLPGAQYPIAFGPHDRWLVTSGISQTLSLWDLTNTRAPVRSRVLASAPAPVKALAFNPGSYWIVAAGASVTVWDLRTPTPQIQPQPLWAIPANRIMFDSGGRYLAVGGYDGTIIVWDLAEGQSRAHTLTGHREFIWSMRLAPDGHTLLSASQDGSVRVWDLAAPNPVASVMVLAGHEDAPTFMGISQDGRTALTFSTTGILRAWNLSAFRPLPNCCIYASALSSDGRVFFGGTSNHIPQAQDLAADSRVPTDLADNSSILRSFLSGDGKRLAVWNNDNTLGVWHLDAVQPIFRPLPLAPPPRATPNQLLAFSHDGTTIAILDNKGILSTWDVRTDPLSSRMITHVSGPFSVAFSPDTRWLAGVDRGKIVLWDLTTDPPAIKQTITGQFAGSTIAFSPNAQYLATPSQNKDGVIVAELDADGISTGQIHLPGADEQITELVFSPDEQLLLSVGGRQSSIGAVERNTIRLWDTRTLGDTPRSVALHDYGNESTIFGIVPVAFSADSRSIIGIEKSGRVRRWRAYLPDVINQACAIASRNLSWEEWQQFFPGEEYRQTCANQPVYPSYVTHLLDQAAGQAQAGAVASALAAYDRVEKSYPQFTISPGHWNKLCRNSLLRGYVKDVLGACGRAVALAPINGAYRDSRGMARALTGDPTGAIEDFEVYIVLQREVVSRVEP